MGRTNSILDVIECVIVSWNDEEGVLFWNNDTGWGSFETCDRYCGTMYRLPVSTNLSSQFVSYDLMKRLLGKSSEGERIGF